MNMLNALIDLILLFNTPQLPLSSYAITLILNVDTYEGRVKVCYWFEEILLQ